MTPSAESASARYFRLLHELLETVQQAESDSVDGAARLIADALSTGHRVVLLGTGHSYALALELCGRAGGFTALEAIHDAALAMSEGLSKSTATERLGGYGTILMDEADLRPGDVLLVISNSGRNAVPVQALLAARERGASTIALTSVAHSRSMPARPPAPGRLFELADVVLDNHGVPGDAGISVPGVPNALGPTSTVVGAAILQAVALRAAELLVEAGHTPEVYRSANV